MRICIISDTHLHKWTQFSETTENDVNSRLAIILRQMEWVAQLAKNTFECTALVHCGDLFHLKSGIPTSVLIPTRTTLGKMESFFPSHDTDRLKDNMIFIAGNHDLEFIDGRQNGTSTNLFAPMTTHEVKSFKQDGCLFTFIPWQKNVDIWKKTFINICTNHRLGLSEKHFVFTHAPLDGAISGIPDYGINQEWLDSQEWMDGKKFKGMIFAGHYHNHKQISPNLISVGALCQHSWNDVGSKAGFVILDTDDEEWQFFESHTPKFVDLDKTPDGTIEGNYVRITADCSIEDAKKLKEQLLEKGALGAIVNLKAKETSGLREISVTTSSETAVSELNKTLKNYIDLRLTGKDKNFVDAVQKQALEVLSEAES